MPMKKRDVNRVTVRTDDLLLVEAPTKRYPNCIFAISPWDEQFVIQESFYWIPLTPAAINPTRNPVIRDRHSGMYLSHFLLGKVGVSIRVTYLDGNCWNLTRENMSIHKVGKQPLPEGEFINRLKAMLPDLENNT